MTIATEQINQQEIARKLKISKGTVSRALRNLPGIHPETRSSVMSMAAELGYRPQRTRVPDQKPLDHRFVGVIQHGTGSQQSDNINASGYVAGMAEAANRLNLSLVLLQMPLAEAEKLIELQTQPPALRDGLLSGLVLIHRWPEHVVKWLSEHYACVSIVHRVEGVSVDTIDMDHSGSMLDVVRHLIDLGHTQIGFFGHEPGVSWSNARFGGYVQALYREGVDFEQGNVVRVSKDFIEGRSNEIDGRIDSVIDKIRTGVLAWVASSDFAGYSLVRGLTVRGIRVPQDVSVTGFDFSPIPDVGLPQLTTVRTNSVLIGSQALRQLLLRIESPSAPEQTISFKCAFLQGDSTAPPPR